MKRENPTPGWIDECSTPQRCLPIGAEVTQESVHFRIWAPVAQTPGVTLEEQSLSPTRTSPSLPLIPEEKGYFSGSDLLVIYAFARAFT
jgi:hypothetical protein